jgi:hypothetical protein
MINSIKSSYSQLEKLEKYLNSNTDRLFITTDTYIALMDIRERLKREISQYEIEKQKANHPYVLKRKKEMAKIRKKIQRELYEWFW